MKNGIRRRIRPGGNGVTCGFNGRIPIFEEVGRNLLLNSGKQCWKRKVCEDYQ